MLCALLWISLRKNKMNNDIQIRAYKPGEPSLVVNFYYRLFEKQFQFLPSTEQYFLHAMEELFVYKEGSELWVAVRGDQIVGSICIVYKGNSEAQLRLFGIDPSVQGQGVGSSLVKTAMDFCKKNNYHKVILWTIDICKAARHIYGKFGFVHTDSKPNTTWANYSMTEELWEYSDIQNCF